MDELMSPSFFGLEGRTRPHLLLSAARLCAAVVRRFPPSRRFGAKTAPPLFRQPIILHGCYVSQTGGAMPLGSVSVAGLTILSAGLLSSCARHRRSADPVAARDNAAAAASPLVTPSPTNIAAFLRSNWWVDGVRDSEETRNFLLFVNEAFGRAARTNPATLAAQKLAAACLIPERRERDGLVSITPFHLFEFARLIRSICGTLK